VKYLRFLLIALATVAVLALLLAGVALTSPLQTWYARMELLDQPGVQGSIGSVSAAFGKLEVEDLRLQAGRYVLTVPALQARLPLIKAMWNRQVEARSVVAKGWTLDLSRLQELEAEAPAPEAESAAGPPASPAPAEKQAAAAFAGILAGRRLPLDVSLDGVELEGEVLLAGPSGKPPIRVRLTVTGGGMASGREGNFAIDAERVTDDADVAGKPASAHCHLSVSMDSPRTVDRIAIRADASGTAASQPVDITVSASAARTSGSGDEAYSVDLIRGDRHLATVAANYPAASGRLSGTWRLDAREADIGPFVPGRPLPSFSLSGDGLFDADTAFERVHLAGRIKAIGSHFAGFSPALGRLGTLTIDSPFDATRRGSSIRFERLGASIGADQPFAEVKTLQPFEFNWESGAVQVPDPSLDFLTASLRHFPLARLPTLPGGLAFSGGEAAADFIVRSTDAGFAVRTKAPLTASGVAIQRAGRMAAQDLELSVPVSANIGAQEWTFQSSPLTVDSGARQLASIEAKGSWPMMGKPIEISGTWKADLEALASLPAVPGLNWIAGRSASGDFKADVGASSDLECKMVLIGHDPAHTVSATVNADEDPGGAGEVLAPVKISFGSDVSDISVEVSWAGEKFEPRSEIKLSSESVSLAHLRLLAAPFAAAGGVPLASRSASGGMRSSAGARDSFPFWGDWVGRVTIAFDRLRTGDQDFTDVGGSFEVDHGSIQLEGGHGELPSKNMANMEGSIAFDAANPLPYSLTGKAAALSTIDSAILLPPQPGDDPAIQGHFSVAGSISGGGRNLDELIAGTQEEFRLTGVNGIVRILKTDVADAIPEAKEPVSDTVSDTGNFIGSYLLGIKGHTMGLGANKVNKTAQAVIDFTNQVSEIGYDSISVTAIRGSDRTIRLTNLEMTSADEHLKGSGQIAYVKGLPISAEPLSVELQLGVHDILTKLLSTAGLLSPAKDSLGYALLREPVHLGGTLAHIDAQPWHDLLAKAAAQKPVEKKAAPAATP
jgi:hypothetical protein